MGLASCRTAWIRDFAVTSFDWVKALGSYAGLTSTPYSSGGIEGAAQVAWFRDRVDSTGRRIRKVMVVALARKLLIALWRFVIDGVMPEGAVMKPSI